MLNGNDKTPESNISSAKKHSPVMISLLKPKGATPIHSTSRLHTPREATSAHLKPPHNQNPKNATVVKASCTMFSFIPAAVYSCERAWPYISIAPSNSAGSSPQACQGPRSQQPSVTTTHRQLLPAVAVDIYPCFFLS